MYSLFIEKYFTKVRALIHICTLIHTVQVASSAQWAKQRRSISVFYYGLMMCVVLIVSVACGESDEPSSAGSNGTAVDISDNQQNEIPIGPQAGTQAGMQAGTQAGMQAGTQAGMQAGTQAGADNTAQIQACEQQCVAITQCESLINLCGESIAQEARVSCQERCTQSGWRAQFMQSDDVCQQQSSTLISALGLADACLAQSTMCVQDTDCSVNGMADRCEGDQLVLYQARCTNQMCTVEQSTVSCSSQGQICRAAQCVTPMQTGIQVGDLLISEIMYNPDGLEDDDAEWFEIHNVSNQVLDLTPCMVTDSDPMNVKELTGLQIPSRGYLLLGTNNDVNLNGGINLDATVDFKLSNNMESLSIICDGVVIDSVSYDDGITFPKAKGSSLSLSMDTFDASANDQASSWCLGQNIYWSDGDVTNAGTPGQANPICPAPSACNPNPCNQPPVSTCEGAVSIRYQNNGMCLEVQGEALCDYPTQEEDCQLQGLVCLEGACVPPAFQAPIIGDLVISEIMYNPTHASDNVAEYIELYNASMFDLDLSTCLVKDSGNSGSDLGPIRLESQGYLLIARSNDASLFDQASIVATFNFGLNNGDDAVQVICDGQVIDEVYYNEAQGFPEATGASLQLDVTALSALNNDLANFWCLSRTEYTAGNFGSPGRANEICAVLNPLCDDAVVEVIEQEGVWEGNLNTGVDLFSATCSDNDQGKDLLYRVIAPQDTVICADTIGSADLSGQVTDTILYVRTGCDDVTSELACQDDTSNSVDSQIQWQAQANVPYDLIVDSYNPLFADRFELNISFAPCP